MRPERGGLMLLLLLDTALPCVTRGGLVILGWPKLCNAPVLFRWSPDVDELLFRVSCSTPLRCRLLLAAGSCSPVPLLGLSRAPLPFSTVAFVDLFAGLLDRLLAGILLLFDTFDEASCDVSFTVIALLLPDGIFTGTDELPPLTCTCFRWGVVNST